MARVTAGGQMTLDVEGELKEAEVGGSQPIASMPTCCCIQAASASGLHCTTIGTLLLDTQG
jgi:hypothetical protein